MYVCILCIDACVCILSCWCWRIAPPPAAGGVERSQSHAEKSAQLATAMDPEYLAALTVEVIPGTVLDKKVSRGRCVKEGTN